MGPVIVSNLLFLGLVVFFTVWFRRVNRKT
ncbi:hypothetical protein PSECIP111951_01724 [Pseudoalteromonas holothuriae]|uniref:Uncharacterized protein n=1 Tax=Pseudoalteromonas holothuriae TaxID=2963714 RepID=A0ABN8UKH9_9GAMM|nr:hypothetical protein PSECIP111951_01724 [Pseudoalteromonas sp. CIP111951]